LRFPQESLLAAELWVRSTRFNPDLPFFPLREADLTLHWNQLSESQRRQAADSAGVELVPRREGRTERLEPQSLHDRDLIAWTHEALTGTRIIFPDQSHLDDETAVD
jgi:hypothetical protein